ncbi:acyl-CoA dehydrogenase family protein [Oricola sp.]|uniref:acyl-CoA dehydrogenase family protein n=1 Tax=Oricola sp. TaxID=1979950 RepID=UPI0025DB6A13|nr:acyl-CoA dehydrogenase family protein [Oricola sp.]MCI5075114.1 acyl-CoA dehydrogenase family protein [Oricola sp.]
MKPFAAPLADILFSINDIAEARRIPDWDADFAGEIAGHFAAFAEGEIAPLDEPGDMEGARLENGRVRLPEGFKRVFDAYVEQGWPGLTAPEAFGGQAMGGAVAALVSEIFSGACHSMQMVAGLGPGAIRTVLAFGTDDQKARMIPPLASGEWLATMCLTEPGAGSDLARIRCRATEAGDGWRIDGEKIFISGGDQDASEGILHLVLARTSDEGIRGLSLFLCRSHKEDGTRNGVTVARIEEKMGLHASPTCQMVFDGAEAELIGRPGEGLKAMFTLMNHARLDVSLQGVAHASRACDIARSYAAERVQGRGPDGAAATLDQHADVRRMLDEMDSLALGSRAIAHLALVFLETGDKPDLVEFLTPVAKVFCSEAGMRAAELGTQILGGYGFLREYRVEQTYRDARITAIYEGANGIHAGALASRGLRVGEGAAQFADLIRGLGEETGQDAVTKAAALWAEARDIVAASGDSAVLAHDFMQLTGAVLFLAVWARIGARAEAAPEPERYARVARFVLRRVPFEIMAAHGRLTAEATA